MKHLEHIRAELNSADDAYAHAAETEDSATILHLTRAVEHLLAVVSDLANRVEKLEKEKR